MDQERASFFHAFGFYYRLQLILLGINNAKNNFDPKGMYKLLRTAYITCTAPMRIVRDWEKGLTMKKGEDEWDRAWMNEWDKRKIVVEEKMKELNELTNDELPDDIQKNEVEEAKQDCYEPLDKLHEMIEIIIWKKGWQIPEYEDIGL